MFGLGTVRRSPGNTKAFKQFKSLVVCILLYGHEFYTTCLNSTGPVLLNSKFRKIICVIILGAKEIPMLATKQKLMQATKTHFVSGEM